MKKNIIIVPIFSFLVMYCGAQVQASATKASASSNENSVSLATVKNHSSSSAITAATFTETNSRLIGRFDRSISGQAKFTWPGSAIEFRFEGTQAAINIASEMQVRFVVALDGTKSDLWVESGSHNYSLASNLASGIHTLRLTRVSESTAGATSFISDPLVVGKFLTPAAAPEKHLLAIGDSITAGYGVEGANANCHYALNTSNQQLTYAALAANALGADLHAIAWSGIGAWRSYGEKSPNLPTILARYTRTLADDATSTWNPTQYAPNAILINIGTNDYWDGAVTDEYRLAMANLIAKVQGDYSGKPIYLIVSPMLTNKLHESQKQVLTALASEKVKVLDLGENDGSEGFGCDYHPNSLTHARLGKVLTEKLKNDLKW